MAVLSPVGVTGDVKIVSPISTFVLNTLTLKENVFFFNYTYKLHFLRFLAEVIVSIVAFFLFFCFSVYIWYINTMCVRNFFRKAYLLRTTWQLPSWWNKVLLLLLLLVSIVTGSHCIILSLVRKATAWRWLRRRHFRSSKRWSFYSRWTRPCKM